MNNEQVTQLIQGIGMMTELWTITYQNFRKVNMSEQEATQHTKAFMSVMMDIFTKTDSESGTQEVK